MHEIDLWPGWCMIAFHADKPIAVLLTAKREGRAHVLKLATHPDHLRQGHASHLLNSLRQKLAILAPKTKMEAIVPNSREDLIQFFEAQGYKQTESYTDFILETRPEGPPEAGPPPAASKRQAAIMVVPVALSDVVALDFYQSQEDIAWELMDRTLKQSEKNIRGLAIPSVDGLIAFILFRTDREDVEIVRLGCENGREEQKVYPILLAALVKEVPGRIRIPKVPVNKPYFDLKTFGFKKNIAYTLFHPCGRLQ